VVLPVNKRKQFWIVATAIPVAVVALFLTTAHYGDDHHGIHYITHPPIASISWGPNDRYIVRHGINITGDLAPRAQAGNFIEFPIFPPTRVSLRLFSFSWLREEFAAWKSNHQKRNSNTTQTLLRSAPPNHALGVTATRCETTFSTIKTFHSHFRLGSGSRTSALFC
jgi:hypothetical protein